MFCEGEVASATLKCLWLDPGMVGMGSALSNKSLPLCNIIQSEIDCNWDLLVNNSLIWQSDFYRLYRLLKWDILKWTVTGSFRFKGTSGGPGSNLKGQMLQPPVILVALCWTCSSLFIPEVYWRPIQVPLNGGPALQWIDCSPQHCPNLVSCTSLMRVAPVASFRSLMKMWRRTEARTGPECILLATSR